MSHKTIKLHISRLMALLLCLTLLLPCIPMVQAEEGSCGDNLKWSFDGITLTITGSGAMYDYSESNKAPWDSLSGQIQKLSLPDGLTRIGKRAFYNCTGLLSVSIPGSVLEIGDAAFCKNSGLTMLTLNSGLKKIGRSAFEECTSLQEVRIPDTVTEIGNHAFYCCESLSYAYIPASVKSFGSGIFSYCTRLSRVDMDVPASSMPGWSFYGCDSLSQVHAQGTTVDASELKQTKDPVVLNPMQPVPDFQDDNVPDQEQTDVLENGDSATGTLVGKTDNSIIANDVTITQTEDNLDVEVDVSATVISPDGWNEVAEHIQILQGPEQENNEDSSNNGETTNVTIYVPDDSAVPADTLKQLAETNVILTVNTSSGAKFKIDCAELDADGINDDLDLSYTITVLDSVPDGIDAATAYLLTFGSSCSIKVEVMVRLPQGNARRAASLYVQPKENTYDFVQSVVVDNDQYAHYYLDSIDRNVQYLIAMDVQGEQSEQAIIPDVLYDEYHLVDHSTGKQYEITGRTSSWGMDLGQVMGILAVVMVSVIVVVGAVMFIWNKRRLKNGYVPDWDDDYE